VILINLNKEKNMKLLKLILIFALGALAIGATLNYTLIGLDWLFDLGLKEAGHSNILDLLVALHAKGVLILLVWPLAGVISDYYEKLVSK